MSSIAPSLVAGSAAIILLLGLVHLLYTFHGPKLLPRDRELQTRMQEVSPVITRQTTMWKAWIGFNASHGFGAVLFGAVYGYLALLHSAFLFQSVFLLALGLLLLVGYVFLAKRYWFRIPLRGILLATLLYALALIVYGLGARTENPSVPSSLPSKLTVSEQPAARFSQPIR